MSATPAASRSSASGVAVDEVARLRVASPATSSSRVIPSRRVASGAIAAMSVPEPRASTFSSYSMPNAAANALAQAWRCIGLPPIGGERLPCGPELVELVRRLDQPQLVHRVA